MDSRDRSTGLPEARISRAFDSRLSPGIREARIQGALNYRRSRSSPRFPLDRTLSIEEEDEMEGRSGDTGSARASANFRDGECVSGQYVDGEGANGDLSSDHFSVADVSGSMENGKNICVDSVAGPPSPLRKVEQV
jgi:hypothetical protein